MGRGRGAAAPAKRPRLIRAPGALFSSFFPQKGFILSIL